MAAFENFDEQMADFEESLGLAKGFITKLRTEDDWAFIIQAHALLEAGVAQLLAHELRVPALQDVFARLDMVSVPGKLTFAEALGVLDKRTRRFIRALGEVRNDFVHNIANARRSLADYLRALDKQQLRAKHEALDWVLADEESVEINGNRFKPIEIFTAAAKSIIAPSLGLVLFQIHLQTSTAKLRQARQQHAERLLQEYFRKHSLRGLAMAIEAETGSFTADTPLPLRSAVNADPAPSDAPPEPDPGDPDRT